MTFQPPRLGPGAIYLRSLDGLFRSYGDLIKVAEIEPQTLWTKGTAADAEPRGARMERRHVAELPQRKLTHGVGYPIGGTICDQERHVGEFRLWNEELESPWTSEHLSILEVLQGNGQKQACGFLMPPVQTDRGVELAAENIRRRREALGLPFAFETGVNYFGARECEMADGDFFRAVAEAADCGILLDLTNLWVNDRNGRAKLEDVLARLPLERVWEVHLAGMEFAEGHWLDAHSREIDPDLVRIAGDLVGSLPNLGTIIFEIAPDRISPFGGTRFLREMEVLKGLWERSAQPAVVPERGAAGLAPVVAAPSPDSPEEWEELIAAQMLRGVGERGAELAAADERSFALYRSLTGSFRSGTIAELFENTTRLLLLGLGEMRLRELMAAYIAETLPRVYPTDEALQFREYLEANPVAVVGLEDVLGFEAGMIEAAANDSVVRVAVGRNIDALLGDIAAGRLPEAAADGEEMVLEMGVDPVPFVRVVETVGV